MLKLVVPDKSLLDPISKRLYPKIAKLYDLTANQVERNIRYLFVDLCQRELATKTRPQDAKQILLPSKRGCQNTAIGRNHKASFE